MGSLSVFGFMWTTHRLTHNSTEHYASTTHYREGPGSLQLSVLPVLVPRSDLIRQLLGDMPQPSRGMVRPPKFLCEPLLLAVRDNAV